MSTRRIEDAQTVIVMTPVTAPGMKPATGSIVVPCESCGDLCWLGPKSAEKKQNELAAFLACMKCVVLKLAPDISQVQTLDPNSDSSFDEAAFDRAVEAGYRP